MKPTAFLAVMILLVAGLTLASGMIHGRLTNRWGPPTAMLAAAERLKGVPTECGDWRRMEKDLEMDETTINMLELEGWINRTYLHQPTGQTVHVAVLLGPPGRISVHTPEICFSSRDHEEIDQRRRIPVSTQQSRQSRQSRQTATNDPAGPRAAEPAGEPAAEPAGEPEHLWALTFRSRDAFGHFLRVYYGWSRGDRWEATEVARWEYADASYLYKIQLSATLPPWAAPDEVDPCQDFLADFLPVLRRYLIPEQENR